MPARHFATVYLALQDRDATLEWLERAFQDGDRAAHWIPVDPAADWIQSDPDYQALIRRWGVLFQ